MSWDVITGEERILPTGGNSNEIKFENNKPRKIKLLLRDGEQPYSYLEHTIEVEATDGSKGKVFRTVRCAKTTKNPNVQCPLCDGQQLKRRARNASNVWDYDGGQVQKLSAGDSVWKPIATSRKLGVNVGNTDWAIMRSGETRNDTEYSVTNLGPSNLAAIPADLALYDIEREYAPHSIEDMRTIVEACGLDWNTITVPPALTFPSLQDALNHVMPNGKYKDQKFSQIWESDKSSKGMINFLATKSDRITPEKAAAQVILVNLGGASIPGVPVGGMASAPAPAPAVPAAQVMPTQSAQVMPTQSAQPVQATQTTSAPVAPATSGRQDKINKINQLLSTKDRYVTGGFTVIMDTLKKASNGKTNIMDFTDAELDAMIVLCEN